MKDWYQKNFAWCLVHSSRYYDRLVTERKRELFSGLHGAVLEIGAGSGPNLRYFPAGIAYTAIEPNEYMHQYLREELQKHQMSGARIISGRAEKLPLESSSADYVISTLVLCSVANPREALAEIQRVLRPGGQFLFLEHVVAPPGTFLKLLQRILTPLWQIFADGCQLDRPTSELIRAAGFKNVSFENIKLKPLIILAPHIIGRAEK